MTDEHTDGDHRSTSWNYDGLVAKGAALVHDGHMNVDDLEIPTRIEEAPGEVNFTAEELREDVHAYLDEYTCEPATEPDDGDDERPVTDGVDWGTLWSEFGFDTKGPLGTYFATPIQLRLALGVSDQATGNPDAHITRAVDEGYLVEITTDGTKGETLTRGYALQRGGGA